MAGCVFVSLICPLFSGFIPILWYTFIMNERRKKRKKWLQHNAAYIILTVLVLFLGIVFWNARRGRSFPKRSFGGVYVGMDEARVYELWGAPDSTYISYITVVDAYLLPTDIEGAEKAITEHDDYSGYMQYHQEIEYISLEYWNRSGSARWPDVCFEIGRDGRVARIYFW